MKRMFWILALACFASVTSVSAAEQVYKIKIANVTAPEHPLNVCFEKMADLMRAKSAGRLDATVFPSGQLGNLRTISEGLQMGTIKSPDVISDGIIVASLQHAEHIRQFLNHRQS